MPPLPIPGNVRVTTLKILGVTLTNGLSVSNHIREIITNCAQTLHALRVLRCHSLPGDAVQTVYRATVVVKLFYACCEWSDFISASDRKRVDAFLRGSKRCGFCPPDLPPFNDLIEAQEDQLFSTINHNPHHLLHCLLPPPSAASQLSKLRPPAQSSYQITTRSRWTSRGLNFISRIIFKDMY